MVQALRDRPARVRIDSRIRRMSLGNPGDIRSVGEGVCEIGLNYGPGYRVYFVQRGEALVVLLAGGDKDSQRGDIKRALELAGDSRGKYDQDINKAVGSGGALGDRGGYGSILKRRAGRGRPGTDHGDPRRHRPRPQDISSGSRDRTGQGEIVQVVVSQRQS